MAVIDDFINALTDNTELRQSIQAATTPAQAVEIAANAGFIVTESELLRVFKTKLSELSEEELAGLSGGKGKTATIISEGVHDAFVPPKTTDPGGPGYSSAGLPPHGVMNRILSHSRLPEELAKRH